MCYFLDSNVIGRGASITDWGLIGPAARWGVAPRPPERIDDLPPPAQLCRRGRLIYPARPSHPFMRRPELAKFDPGQSFSIAARRRYDRKHGRGLSIKSKLVLEPRPQKIGYGQPGRLFRVNLAAENDKDAVPSRCVAADQVAIPPHGRRFGNEHAAYTAGCANHGLSFVRSLRYRNGEVLADQELGDFELRLLLCKHARIAGAHR
jgi:hypothetical protein